MNLSATKGQIHGNRSKRNYDYLAHVRGYHRTPIPGSRGGLNLGLYNDSMNKITFIDNESPITSVTFTRDDNETITIANFSHDGFYEFTNHAKNVEYRYTTAQIQPFLDNNPHIRAALDVEFCTSNESCVGCEQISRIM